MSTPFDRYSTDSRQIAGAFPDPAPEETQPSLDDNTLSVESVESVSDSGVGDAWADAAWDHFYGEHVDTCDTFDRYDEMAILQEKNSPEMGVLSVESGVDRYSTDSDPVGELRCDGYGPMPDYHACFARGDGRCRQSMQELFPYKGMLACEECVALAALPLPGRTPACPGCGGEWSTSEETGLGYCARCEAMAGKRAKARMEQRTARKRADHAFEMKQLVLADMLRQERPP